MKATLRQFVTLLGKNIRSDRGIVFLAFFAVLLVMVATLPLVHHPGAEHSTKNNQITLNPGDFTIADPTKIENVSGALRLVDQGGSTYPTDYPYVTSTNPISYTSFGTFSQVLGSNNTGQVLYRLSPNGIDWYWWDGGTWDLITISDTADSANTATEVSSRLDEFASQFGAGNVYIRAFFKSNGTQKVELQQVKINTFTTAAPTISSITPNFGAISGGTNVTITGTNFSGASLTDTIDNSWPGTGTISGGYGYRSMAIVGDYIYLFAGYSSGNTSIIHRAPLSNPTNWSSAGNIPAGQCCSAAAVIGNYVYLYGGYQNATIYRGSTSDTNLGDAGSWTTVGSIPAGGDTEGYIVNIFGGYVYLFKGNVVYRAPVSDPTNFSAGTSISAARYPQSVVIGDKMYLYSDTTILSTSLANPTTWINETTTNGKSLPVNARGGQIVVIGNTIYLYVGGTIMSAPVSDPTTWTNLSLAQNGGKTLPGGIATETPQIAIIDNTLYMFSRTSIRSTPITGNNPNVYNPFWITNRPTVTSLSNLYFGDTPATNVEIISPTEIHAKAPPHAQGLTDVSYTNGDGQSATLLNGFEYVGPPTISSVSPSSGLASGGDIVTITGTNFRPGTTVTFGNIPATNVTVLNSTTITATSPAVSAAGSVTIKVTNSDGQVGIARNAFTYLDPPPQAVEISPTSGPANGGTTFTVSGSGFIPPNKTDNTWTNAAPKTLPNNLQLGASAVIGDKIYLYGGYETRNIYVADVSDPTTWQQASGNKQLPDATYGSQVAVIDDTVYIYGGRGSNGKIYSAPVSDPATVTPVNGKVLPGNIEMYGSQIAVIGNKMYLFGSYDSAQARKILSANVSDPTTWTDETIAQGKSLSVDMGFAGLNVIGDKIYIFGGSGAGSTIIYANVSDPLTWYTTGKSIGGSGFGQSAVIGDSVYYFAATTDRIYSAPISDPTTWTDTGKTLPASNGRMQIALINDRVWLFGGTNAIYSAHVDRFRPNFSNRSWMTNWPTSVLSQDQSGVTFDGVPATNVRFLNSTTITGTTPPHATGNVDVAIKNYDGQSSTLANGYEYLPPPEITGLIPSSGTMAGGDTVTITGNNFQDGATVAFGDIEAASVTYVDEHTLIVVTPAQLPIAVDVTVTNPDDQKAVAAGGFTFLAPPPEVTSVTPTMGPMAGGTEVTINGTGFISQNTTTNQWSLGPSTSAARWGSPAMVIGDKIYKFGGGINTNTATGAIYSAPVSNPTAWSDTGKSLPSLAVGAQFAIIGDTIYMFGGNAASPLNTIFSAPVSDPTTWTNTNKTLPGARYFGQLAIVGDTIYLYGGFSGNINGSAISFNSSTNTVFSAPVSDPTTWTNTNISLPSNIAGSQLMTIGNTMYMFGGHNGTSGIDTIYSASTSAPTTWTTAGSLPEARYGATLAAIGSKLYLYGGSGVSGSRTIYAADISNPTTWTLTPQTLSLSTEFASFMTIDNKIYTAGSLSYAQLESAPVNLLGPNYYNQPWTTDWPTSAPTTDQSNVSFGGVPATDITFVSTTEIKAKTPPHSPGPVNVTVTNADGQNDTLNNSFTYLPDAYAFTTAPLDVAATEPGAITIEARDANGNPVVSTEDITLQLSTNSDSGFFARNLDEDESTRWSYDSVVLPAGQSSATFYYKDNLQGTPIVTVKDPNNTQAQQQQTIGPRFKLLVTGVSDPIQAGVPSSVTIQAVDYQGQPQTDYTGTVHFTSTDTSASLPSDFTFTPDMLGLHTFVNGVSMATQGEWCVTATDTSSASITGSQCNITVTPPNAGTISKLKIITQPQSFSADGHSSAITVQTQDVNGLPIPVASDTQIYVYSDSGTGQFSLDGETGWTTASPFQITIKAGTTSANVYYKDTTTGTHTLTMRDDEGTGTDFGWTNDSQQITVGVGEPSQLGMTTPGSAAAGEWFPVTIHLQDSVGNDVTSFKNIPVHMTSSSGTARFSHDITGSNPNTVLDTTLPAGSSTITIYASETTAGQLTITTTDTSSADAYNPGSTDVAIGPGEPVSIAFLPLADSVKAGEPKQVAAFLKDTYGNTAIATQPVSVTFDTTSDRGGFNTSINGPWPNTFDVTINPGASTATAFYRDTRAGNPTLTASTSEYGDAELQVEVAAGPYSGKLSYKTAPSQFVAGTAQTIEVELLDDYDNPTVAETAVHLTTSSSSLTGEFSTDGNTWLPNLSFNIGPGEGTASLSYRDTKTGSVTIATQEVGKPATRITYNPTVVAGAPTKYVYTSNPQIITKNSSSGPIVIELQDQYNNIAKAPNGLSATLSTTGTTGEFSLNGSSGWTAGTLTLPFAEGASNATAYYRDSTNGTYTLTVSGNGITEGAQDIRIVEGVPGRVALIPDTTNITAGQPVAVTLETQTTGGIPTPVFSDTTFDLSDDGGEFSLSVSPWNPIDQATLQEGESDITLYYRNTEAGVHTVQAAETPSQGWTDGSATFNVGGGEVYRFAFTAKPANVPVTEASGTFAVSTLDIYGNVTSPSSDTTAYLYTSASSGAFGLNASGPWDVTSVTIPAGGNTTSFYYRDTSLGTPTITASDKSPLENPDEDILNASTPIDVVGQQAAKLVFTTGPHTIIAGNLTSIITVQLQKADDTPAIQGSDVTFTLDGAGPGSDPTYFAVPDAGSTPITQFTIPRGETSASFYATSTKSGIHEIHPYTFNYPGVGLIHQRQNLTVDAAVPEELVFVTTPQTIHASEDSAQMKVELRDMFGNPATASADTVVNFSSSCGTGQFSLANGSSWSTITSTTIPAGQSDVYFYYRDAMVGTCTLTVSGTDLQSAQQNIEITYGAATQLGFTTPPQTIVAGQQSGSITVSALDIYGNVTTVDQDTPVYFSSTSSTGQFSQNSAIIPAGESSVSVTYRDTSIGTPLLTARDQSGDTDINLNDANQSITITRGTPTKFGFSPETFNVSAGHPQELKVELRNEFNVPIPVDDDTVIDLTSTVSDGEFRTSENTGDPTITHITIPSGQSAATIFYRQTTASTATLNASNPDTGFTGGTATATVYSDSLKGMRFITAPQTLEANQPSGAMTVTAIDEFGNTTAFSPTPMTLYLYSNSPTAKFYADPGLTNQITSITINSSNTETLTFYYRDTNLGNATVTVSDKSPLDNPDIGITNANQDVTIIPGTPTQLTIEGGSSELERGGTDGPNYVVLKNAYNHEIKATNEIPIYLSNSSATGEFSIGASGPWQHSIMTTIPQGESRTPFYFRDDSTIGLATITASDISSPPEVPDTGLTNGIKNINVISGAFAQLAFTTSPQEITARHPSDIMTVQALNRYGKPTTVTSDTLLYLRSNVASGEFATVASGPWGISNVTMPAGSSSISFFYRDSKDGTPTLRVSNSLSSNPSGVIATTQQQTIKRQVLSHFLVTNISDPQYQGNPSSVVVAAVDSENFVIDWYNGTVHFNSSDSDAVLPSSYTFNSAKDKGIHTFVNGVAFRHAGEKTVTVTDSNNISGQQTDITVLGNPAGPPAKLAFIAPTTPPLVITKGQASDTVTLQIQDSNSVPTVAGPGGFPVRLTSTAATGEFATSPTGPWQSAANLTIPEGLGYINLYYRDNTIGQPQVTARDWTAGVDNPAITNATLDVTVNSLNFTTFHTLQSRNYTDTFVANPFFFSPNDQGSITGRAAFTAESIDEGTQAPYPANWILTWSNSSGTILDQQTYENTPQITYNPSDITAQAGDNPFNLDVQVTNIASNQTTGTVIEAPVSPWQTHITTPNTYTLGNAWTATVESQENHALKDAEQGSIELLNSSLQPIGVQSLLTDAERTSTGTYKASILSPSLVSGETYYALIRLVDASGDILAEDLSSPFQVKSSTTPGEEGGGTTNLPTSPGGSPTPGGGTQGGGSNGSSGGVNVLPGNEETPTSPSQNKPGGRDRDTTSSEPRSFVEAVGEAIKRFLSAPEAPVVISNSLFGLVAFIALILLWQAYKELQQVQWLLAILAREKQTAEDKDDFLRLCAHYLRTPITIIAASSDMLTTRLGEMYAETLQALSGVTHNLQQKAEELLAQATENKALQSISAPDISVERRNLYLNPIFWLPVILSIVLTILANWAIITIGNQSLQGVILLEQIAVAIVAIILLYTSLRLLAMRRKRKEVLDETLQHRAELDRAKNQFVTNAYNLLADDVSILSGLQQKLPAEEQFVQMVADGTTRLEKLMDKFKLFSHINTTQLHLSSFTVSQLVDQSLAELSKELEAKKLSINRNDTVVDLTQDASLFGRVVHSVIANAVEFNTTENGHIKVDTDQGHNNSVTVRVKDNGPGFKQDPEELFDAFKRGDDSLDFTHEGIGLDLYLDRLIMRHLGGHITARNAAGGGAEVALTLPDKPLS